MSTSTEVENVNGIDTDVTVTGNAVASETLLFLDTAQIIEPEATNVRPWSAKVGDTEAEIKKIEALAATIEEEGQIQPVRVRWQLAPGAINSEDGYYELIAGRRRKKAIELINAGRKAGEELRIVAIVSTESTSDPKAFRQAAIENWHREGLSPMDMAADIATVRGNFKWQGSKGTKKVAEFFKVSPATITQYETLLKLPKELQGKVHTGELTRDNAFMLAAISDKQGAEVAAQVAADAESAGAAVETEVMQQGDVESEAPKKTNKKATKKAAAAKTKVIKQAAREADPDKKTPRSKKEIMDFFTSCYGPAYGHPSGAVHKFVGALEQYAAGELSDRTLYKYWDACVDKADKGVPEVAAKSAKGDVEPAVTKQAPAKKKKSASKKK